MTDQELLDSLEGTRIKPQELTVEIFKSNVETKALLHTILDYQIEILAKLRDAKVEDVEKEVNETLSGRVKQNITESLEILKSISLKD